MRFIRPLAPFFGLVPALVMGFEPCPLLGPVFAKPSNFLEQSTIKDALSQLAAALKDTASTGNTGFGTFGSSANAFSVAFFDTSAQKALFGFQHTSDTIAQGKEGTREINDDTIFRVGSLSKLITTYLFLTRIGDGIWQTPVTDYVPELNNEERICDPLTDPINCTSWCNVTLGSLASHVAGITRDWSGPGELLSQGLPLQHFGFPPLSANQTPAIPTCNLGRDDPCPTEVYFKNLAGAHPIYAPYTTPTYSNAGFAVLGLVLEKITGKNISQTLGPDLFNRIGMFRSSYAAPSDLSNAALPGGSEASGFLATLSNESPVGGYYSTLNDMVKLGRSILSSTILPATVTREWLKPDARLTGPNQAVGKPWEIFRVNDLGNHRFDLYTKSGDLFSYSSMLILSPDHNVGFAILAAGNDTTNTVQYLSDTVVAGLFPAIEETARLQADAAFAGRYASSDPAVNSSVVLTTQKDSPGLIVESWISNGTDFFLPLKVALKSTAIDVRLYPSNLVDIKGPGEETLSYRAVFQDSTIATEGGVFSSPCQTWFNQNAIQYGGIGIDEFTFDVKDGKVLAMSPRALRISLEKK